MEAHLAPNPHVQVNKIASSCEICSGPHDTQYSKENPKQNFVDYASSRTNEAGGRKKESYKPQPTTDGISARPPYYAKQDFMDYHFPREWESTRDAELNPFKDVLVFRKMVEFLGTILINPKGNMWESEELIEKRIDWNMPPKEGDGAWHIMIELINPDREKFNKTFQSIYTIRKLSEKANLSEIIDLYHFHSS
ncbi:hypothetical protein Tco_0806991 [Tanacetum coccineum]